MTETMTDPRDLAWLDTVPARDRDRVAALIPSYAVYEAYTHRRIGKGLDFEAFDLARKLRHNVMLPGPSGAGKTTAARAYAAREGLPFVSIEMSAGIDFDAVFGGYRQNVETGVLEWTDGELTIAVRHGGVAMVDEVNFSIPKFTAAIHGLLDARQSLYLKAIGERVPKHKDCLIISAYNPGYRGTGVLNEAFLNRYTFTIGWGYDAEVEQARIGQYSPTLLTLMRQLRSNEAITTDVGTNWGEDIIEICVDGGRPDLALVVAPARFEAGEDTIVYRTLEAQLPRICVELGVEYEVDDYGSQGTADEIPWSVPEIT